VSDTPRPGWWQASDGRWYAPEQHPNYVPPPSSPYGQPHAGSPYGQPHAGSPYGPPPAGPFARSPYAGPNAYWPGPPEQRRTSGLAIASFVCSLGAFVLAGIPAIVGIILGFVARSQIRRSQGAQGGAGLALAGVIVGFAEIALTVLLVVAVVGVVVNDQRKVQITGAGGYTTFTGSDGKAMAEGRPWGVTCEPVVFQAGSDVPDSIYIQLTQVVLVARAAGVDVTVATRQNRWYPTALYPAGLTNRSVQFVSVFTNDETPPLLGFGQPEHIEFEWNTSPSRDGTHDVVTYLQADMYLKALTSTFDIRRAVRQLIAFSQGVAGSDAAGSGIATESTVDAFSAGDYAAMRLMSGCRHPPP
jgi:Domain of unknown function (DUF4190)